MPIYKLVRQIEKHTKAGAEINPKVRLESVVRFSQLMLMSVKIS